MIQAVLAWACSFVTNAISSIGYWGWYNNLLFDYTKTIKLRWGFCGCL